MRHLRERDAAQQALIGTLGSRNRVEPWCRELEIALRPPAALWRRVSVVRRDEAFVLEAVERGVERPGRRFAIRTRRHLRRNARPVGAVLQPQDRQQDDLLELAELDCGPHL